MKKEITKEVTICDSCKKESSYGYHCVGCKLDFCYGCNEKMGKNFSHAVYASGSGDGYFCNTCIAQPSKEVKALFEAYIRIQALREEAKIRYESFKRRVTEAEEEVKKLNNEI